jgi:hypothetical protein
MTRLTLENLSGIMDSLGGLEEPKTIVFVSGGLSTPTRDAPTNRAPGPCELKPDDFEAVGKSARAARAHVYVLQPHELGGAAGSDGLPGGGGDTGFSQAQEAIAGLQNLTGVTGGQFFTLGGFVDPVFTQVASESSGYYMVDFKPEAAERNGLQHRIEIRVAAADVTIRHHPQFVIARGESKDPSFLTPQDMLRGVRRFRTLPLRAIAYTAQDGEGLAVLAIAEPFDPAVRITAAAMAIVDSNNRLVRQSSTPTGAPPQDSIAAKFPVPPGNYRLRVAAIDTQGRHGTVEYSFTAHLTPAGPLKLSGIALGVSEGGQFKPRMVFGQEPAAAVYVEMYGRMPEPAVRIELAETAGGPAVVSVAATVEGSSVADRRIALGSVPIGSLFPGDYLVRVVVTNDGKPLGVATRTLRKVAEKR